MPWILQEVWATCQASGLVAKAVVILFDAIQAKSALLSPSTSLKGLLHSPWFFYPFCLLLTTFCLFLSLCIFFFKNF